ncbi:MAG: hypothetical protein ACYC3W_05400 [Candidatus Nanopelagicales bacterium]
MHTPVRIQARTPQGMRRPTSDRGDVPGWVLVTLMTAGLVSGIWLLADGQLNAILTRALSSVGV